MFKSGPTRFDRSPPVRAPRSPFASGTVPAEPTPRCTVGPSTHSQRGLKWSLRVEHMADFNRQFLDTKRFGQQACTRLQNIVMHNGISGVAGGE
jgi:hypothetical protein